MLRSGTKGFAFLRMTSGPLHLKNPDAHTKPDVTVEVSHSQPTYAVHYTAPDTGPGADLPGATPAWT